MLSRREFTLLAGALVAAPAAVLEACGGASSSPSSSPAPLSTAAADLQMVWWGNADRANRTQKVITLFQQKSPQYKFTTTWGANSTYFDKLNTQIASGAPPDIIQMDMKYLATYAAKGVLLDLGKFGPDALDLSSYSASLLKQVRGAKGMFALPSAQNMFASLYNTSLIARAGGTVPDPTFTWQQFAAWCVALGKSMPKGSWATDDFSGAINALEGYVHSMGYEMYTADGKIGYTKQTVSDWFTYWSDLRKAGGVVPPDISIAASNTNSQSQSTLVTGKAAVMLTHSNFLEQYQPLTKDTLAIGPYPKGKRSAVWPHASQAWSISARTKYPSQAVQFLNFSINDPGAQQALGVERGAPPVAKANALITPSLNTAQKAELDYDVNFAKGAAIRATLDPPGSLDVTTALQQQAQAIQLGTATVQAATDKFWQLAQQALQ